MGNNVREHMSSGEVSLTMLCSNLNMEPRQIALGGLRNLNDYVNGLTTSEGEPLYDGVELTLTRRQWWELKDGEADDSMIKTYHQSWGQGLGDVVLGRARSKVALGGAVCLCEADASLKDMARLQSHYGAKPTVVYPEKVDPSRPVQELGLQLCGAQIQADTCLALGASNPLDLEEVWQGYEARGITSGIVDTAKVGGCADESPDFRLDPEKTLNSFKKSNLKFDEMHIATGRTDLKNEKDRRDSYEDLRALVTGGDAIAGSRVGAIIDQSCEIYHDRHPVNADSRLILVTETTDEGLAMLVPGGRKLTARDRCGFHEQIVLNLRDYIGRRLQ